MNAASMRANRNTPKCGTPLRPQAGSGDDRHRVSVAIATYNHAAFIAKALESALAQKTPFPFEIVVADDCSTDGTSEIVSEIRRRHPDRIRLLERPRRLGMCRNVMELYAACEGDSIAWLEGDDVWTSPDKLRRQVELLDARADLALCHHRVEVIDDRGFVVGLHPPDGAPITRTLEGLLLGDCIVTCSTMVRRLFDRLPEWLADLPLLDWPLFVLHALHGGVGYLPEAMAAYRLHAGGVWSPRSRREKLPAKIEARSRVARVLGPPYDSMLAPVIARLRHELDTLEASREQHRTT
jgi:glycosyltransferase involved in cell wall biosynthesis